MDPSRLNSERVYSVTAPASWFSNLFKENGLMILLLVVVAVVILVILWPNLKASMSGRANVTTTTNGNTQTTTAQPGGLFSSSNR